MSVTLRRIEECLEESGLKYRSTPEMDGIHVGFFSDPGEVTYRDKEGRPHIEIFIKVLERGEFLSVSSPECWILSDCLDENRVLGELVRVASGFKMIRFDLHGEGYVAPNVEIALEDNDITTKQLERAIGCILQCVRERHDRIYAVIREEQMRKVASDAGGAEFVKRLLDGRGP